ncbi:MAG: hypothetical protein QOH49_492 [Acidobacteriota bacterium]|nr:hypothetical protein [Acidobacteriota bacterium]
MKGYTDETRHAIKNALDENTSDLAELVRRAEGGEDILDVRGPFVGAESDSARAAAHVYAQRAYDAARDHYHAHQGDMFALSRLAVVYEESKPGDVHMVVTLPGVVDVKTINEAQAREAIKDAELLARTLEHEGCPDAFKTAFGAIFAEHILDGSDVSWTTPEVVRVMLPLTLFKLWKEHDGSADEPVDIPLTLSSELVSDEVDRDVRASLRMQ